jgi:hypothetical protein
MPITRALRAKKVSATNSRPLSPSNLFIAAFYLSAFATNTRDFFEGAGVATYPWNS